MRFQTDSDPFPCWYISQTTQLRILLVPKICNYFWPRCDISLDPLGHFKIHNVVGPQTQIRSLAKKRWKETMINSTAHLVADNQILNDTHCFLFLFLHDSGCYLQTQLLNDSSWCSSPCHRALNRVGFWSVLTASGHCRSVSGALWYNLKLCCHVTKKKSAYISHRIKDCLFLESLIGGHLHLAIVTAVEFHIWSGPSLKVSYERNSLKSSFFFFFFDRAAMCGIRIVCFTFYWKPPVNALTFTYEDSNSIFAAARFVAEYRWILHAREWL